MDNSPVSVNCACICLYCKTLFKLNLITILLPIFFSVLSFFFNVWAHITIYLVSVTNSGQKNTFVWTTSHESGSRSTSTAAGKGALTELKIKFNYSVQAPVILACHTKGIPNLLFIVVMWFLSWRTPEGGLMDQKLNLSKNETSSLCIHSCN